MKIMNKETIRAWKLYDMSFNHPLGDYYTNIVCKNDECKVYISDKNIDFVFRGSNDIKDWINNFKISDSFEKLEYHHGFLKSAIRFKDSINNIIKNNKNKKISFIGFSRGGAIALILAIKLCKNDKNRKIDCFTFGQPRIAKKGKVKELFNLKNLNYTRVFYAKDLVPGLPFKIQDFKHLPGTTFELPAKFWHYIPLLTVKVKIHTSYGDYFKEIKNE